MNKFKLIEIVKNRCSLTQKESTDLVNLFFQELQQLLQREIEL